MNYSTLTIITPTLNEADNIRELIESLVNLYPDVFIIVADDGSNDGTQDRVLEINRFNKHIILLDRKNEPVKGLTASIVDGILKTQTKFFCVIDADLQHPPEVIGQIYDNLINGYDIVSGRRNPYKENQGLHRIIVTKIATIIARIYFKILKGFTVHDPMSGLFGGHTYLVQEIIKNSQKRFEPKGYKVLFDILKACPRGVNFKDILYQFRFRTGGQSKMSAKHGWYFLRGLLK